MCISDPDYWLSTPPYDETEVTPETVSYIRICFTSLLDHKLSSKNSDRRRLHDILMANCLQLDDSPEHRDFK